MCPLVLKCNFYPMIIFPLSPFKIGHADKMAVIGGAVRGAQAPRLPLALQYLLNTRMPGPLPGHLHTHNRSLMAGQI